jgi:hypothetical protein
MLMFTLPLYFMYNCICCISTSFMFVYSFDCAKERKSGF